MINFNVSYKRIYTKSKSEMVTNSQSSIQNIYNWRLWIRKNKIIIQFNKSATTY